MKDNKVNKTSPHEGGMNKQAARVHAGIAVYRSLFEVMFQYFAP